MYTFCVIVGTWLFMDACGGTHLESIENHLNRSAARKD